MKTLLTLLFLGMAMTIHAANPSYSNFDTNQFLRTGNLLSIKTNAFTWGEMWTNTSGVISLVTQSNLVRLGIDYASPSTLQVYDTNINTSASVGLYRATDSGANPASSSGALFVQYQDVGSTPASWCYALQSMNLTPANAAGATYYLDGSIGVAGVSGSGSGGSNTAAVGVSGYVYGTDYLLIGVLGEAEPRSEGSTNVGVLGNVVIDELGTHVAGYFEVTEGSDDPIFESGVVIADNRESDLDLFIARTNNGTHIAVLDKSGVWTANGFVGPTGYTNIVGGLTANITVVTNGTDTATLHFVNGVLTQHTAP